MTTSGICLIAAGLAALLGSSDPPSLTSHEVQRRWHERLEGAHFVARIRMDVDLGGMREKRELTVYRDDGGSAAERVLIRFEAPAALRKMGLLYFEHADRPNDYFLYRPAVRRVRRLQEHAVQTNLYGIDPEFLGFGIARTEPTRIKGFEDVQLNGRRAYRLDERARKDNPRFDRRTVWIDRETFIPLRTEHRLDGRTVLIAETLEVRKIQGVPTPVRMRFERPVDQTYVDMVVEGVDYATAIPEEVFSVFKLTTSQRRTVPSKED